MVPPRKVIHRPRPPTTNVLRRPGITSLCWAAGDFLRWLSLAQIIIFVSSDLERHRSQPVSSSSLSSTSASSSFSFSSYRSVNLGGSRVLDCDINWSGVTSSVTSSVTQQSEHILTWRKDGVEVPIFIQFNGYPPHIEEGFQGRIRLLDQASIELTDVRGTDEGWYECSVVFLHDSSDGSIINGTRIYLTVYALPVLGEVSPSFLIQKIGETVDIFCEANGNPDPTLSWYKDGRQMTPSDRISIGHNLIQMRKLGPDDGGLYNCTFRNIIGQISHAIRLVIEGNGWNSSGNVYILVPPVNTTAFQGSRVKLNCLAEGYPNNITYQWFHDDGDVHNSPGLMTRAGIFADGSFVITSVVREDIGWYRCQPSNGVGTPPEAQAFLNVTYLPRVLSVPVRTYLPRGMMGKMECPTEANPPVSLILWAKNERIIDLTQMTRLKANKEGALVIKTVITTDEGTYTCTPYSPLGFGQVSTPIQVLVRDPPYFSIRPLPIYQSQMGESITMSCSAEGDPRPTLSWKKVEGAFPPIAKTQKDGGNLTIRELRKEDHGLYECIATNVVANAIATSLLIIEHTTPHAPYNVSVDTDRISATVSWLPAYDGGHPQHYVLWFKLLKVGVKDIWQTMRILPDDATSVTIYKLQPSTLYQFMVLSRNRLGDGLFSKPVTIATKGPDVNLGILVLSPSPRQLVVPSPTTNFELEPTQFQKEQEFGPRPLPPFNLSVHQLRNGSLNISWQAPVSSPSPILFYQILYRTVGQWVPLNDRLTANVTWYLWTTASRGAIYSFKVTSYGQLSKSDASSVVLFNTGDAVPSSSGSAGSLLGSILGLVLILVAVISLFFSLKYFVKRKQRKKSTRYGNIRYFGPNHAEDSSQNGKRFPKEPILCDIVESDLSNNSIKHLTTIIDHTPDRKMKETPI